MPAIRFGRVETSLGPMWVAETDAGVAALSRSELDDERSRFGGRQNISHPAWSRPS